MKHASEASPPNPFDLRALWEANGGAAAFGGDAMRTWLDSATRMQAEATAFWTGRASKDMAALTMIGRCTNPAEAMEAQMRYAREAVADFYAEGQRMMRMASEVTKVTLPGMPGAGKSE